MDLKWTELAYDKVFVASRDGIVKALAPETGEKLWENDLEKEVIARLSGGLTAAYGKVFLGSENGEVIALDESTGEELWRVSVNGEVLASPVTENNMVIVHTSRGMLLKVLCKCSRVTFSVLVLMVTMAIL